MCWPPLQVIEKAYKKLRLDALVIQQGRLVESTKGVNKDDLLSMVRPAALSCPAAGCLGAQGLADHAHARLARTLNTLLCLPGRPSPPTHHTPPPSAVQVRYGAERVFSSEASNITEEDVDALIAKGEAATKELNDKLQNFSDNAMKFTMDGGISGGWVGVWGGGRVWGVGVRPLLSDGC